MSEGDPGRRQAIDWQAARAAVAEADERLRRVLDRDPAFEEALLAQRTTELAQPADVQEPAGQPVLLLTVRSGRFAVPVADGLRVERLRRWTPIPRVAPELIGIAAFQGRPYLLANLEVMVGGTAGTFDGGDALLLRRPDCALALCADRIDGVQTFAAPVGAEAVRRHVVAIDADRLGLLDVDSIVERAIQWDGLP